MGLRGLLLCALLFKSVASDSPDKVWSTQNFPLKAGWSAIYSLVDATHVTLDQLTVGAQDIEEIWRWTPEFSSLQFLDSPEQPNEVPSNWMYWRRDDNSSTLHFLDANAAFLVRLRDGAGGMTWQVKGMPVAPLYNWKSDGMNLIGFSTVPMNAPTFEDFLLPVPRLLNNTPIYQYWGGLLDVNNPRRVMALRTTPVHRGEAFWVRANDSQRYYGPLEVQLQDVRGIHFRDTLARYRIVLRNVSASSLTVQGSLLASETVPSGVDLIEGTPTLLIRGALNPDTLTYGFQSLSAGNSLNWTLAPRGQPGSEVSVVLGMNWSSLSGSPGDLNGAILRFTDGMGHMQYDVAVTARVPDPTGLWVGEATITHVQQDLQSFRKSSDQGRLTATSAGDIDVIWVKRLPEPETPADAADTDKWLEIDGFYFRKLVQTYNAVLEGSVLAPPNRDENGELLSNPGFYWQARPYHPSYSAGYYYNPEQQAAYANGYQTEVTLQWRKVDGVPDPDNGVFRTVQEETYSPALENQRLERPTWAAVDVGVDFWEPRPAGAPDPAPFQYDSTTGEVHSLVSGDLELVWLKTRPEETAPDDAGNVSKWLVVEGQYFRKFPVQYSGVELNQLMVPPAEDELGNPIDSGSFYWQEVPYHPSRELGYAFHPPNQVIATGTVADIIALWLPMGETDPDLATPRRYTHVVGGTVLEHPDATFVEVDPAHWHSMPDGAPLMTAFHFEPLGDTYEITKDGKYIPVSTNNEMAAVARPMPLRLIFHSGPGSAGSQTVHLLQRVYFATDADAQLVLANQPQWITETSSPIRRISSVHTPWTEANHPLPCVGNLQFGVSGEHAIHYADPISNPFVHVYHPDHDNFDPRYEMPLPEGEESYSIRRLFTLSASVEEPSFDSLSRSGDTRVGIYEEEIRLAGAHGHVKSYRMRGGYLMRRIIRTPQLLTQ